MLVFIFFHVDLDVITTYHPQVIFLLGLGGSPDVSPPDGTSAVGTLSPDGTPAAKAVAGRALAAGVADEDELLLCGDARASMDA